MSNKLKPLLQNPYICSRCLSKPAHHRRAFSTSRASAPPPPPSSGYAELTHRGIISLSGTDAPKFLQGLTTNNVDPARKGGWYSGFLNATGRVLWDAFVYPSAHEGGGYLIEVDEGEVEAFVRHLKRHKLRSKVAIRDAREEWRVWSVWRDGRGIGPEDPAYSDALLAVDHIAMMDPRLPALGDRVLLSRAIGTPSQAFSRYEELMETPLSSYTIRRYLNGVPEGQEEMVRETALPLESNMDYLNGIDFRKGCYVGQELTIRTQHTGVVRKRILPVQLYTSDPPNELVYDTEDPVAQVLIQARADIKSDTGKRPTGKFQASVGNIGLALCRLENMTDLRVSAEGGNYKEGMEFSIAAEREGERVKLKAFVPEWLREREREKMERRSKREEVVD